LSETRRENSEISYEINNKIDSIKEKISKIEEIRNSTCIIFFTIGSIDYLVSNEFFNIIRKEKKIENLDMILESGGGQIEDALKIAHLCKDFSNKFSVLVPYYAKSAATLIALYADELILCKAAELGPIDPQVKHPVLDMFIPASSIKNALKFIESSKDPYIKMIMADKLDPFIIGAYNQAIDETKIYLEEIPKVKNAKNKNEILDTFTTKYLDHGYPITHKECENLNLCSTENLDDNLENLLYDIRQFLLKLMLKYDIDYLILTKEQVYYEIEKKKVNEFLEES